MSGNGGSPSPVVECKEWRAWYNREPIATDERLHVAGRVRCLSSDIKLTLEPTNEGVVDDPELFVLTFGYSGERKTDDIAELDVTWAGDVGDDIKSVEIHGECQAQIDVQILS
jgi:hypothetical protein